jgi:hypothetical protein
MSLTIVVNGGGTFSASMEEGPVSFTASLGAVPGPKGDTGATGPTGVIAATAPVTYDSGTQTVAMDTAYFVRSPEVAATDGQILSWDADTLRPLWIANDARTLFLNGTNKTGTTIAKGKAVYISGATGNHPEITLAQADTELSSSRTIGITAEAIADNGTGKVIVAGALENVDTSAFVAGDVLYLSASSAGGFQTTLPTQPNHGVLMGYVVRSNASTGVIEVRVDNYQELGEQSDVLLTSKANNDLLAYESATGLWKNKSFATLGLATSADLNNYYTQAEAEALFQTIAGMSSYLTTSAAATTYAPIVHTHTASAITDFDTAALAAIPDASTTVKGKVELATDAEAVAGTSNSLAVTPRGVINSEISPSTWRFYGPDFTTATSGTGGLNDSFGAGAARRTNGPTSTGAGHVVANHSTPPYAGQAQNGNLNWTRRVSFSARIIRAAVSPSSESIYLVTLGEAEATNTGDPTVPSIGIKVTGSGAMVLMAHDGTTLSTSTTTHTPSTFSAFDLLVVSDGAGNVEAFVNGVSVGTTTGGPTTLVAGTDNRRFYKVRVENTSSFTSAPQNYYTYQSSVAVL